MKSEFVVSNIQPDERCHRHSGSLDEVARCTDICSLVYRLKLSTLAASFSVPLRWANSMLAMEL